MTLPLHTSDTAPLRKRLAALQGRFAAFVLRIDGNLSRLERTGSDHGDYWRERKLDEISRDLAAWEGRG